MYSEIFCELSINSSQHYYCYWEASLELRKTAFASQVREGSAYQL